MTEKTSKGGSLDDPEPQVRKRNTKFEQEVADSRDHTKQSGHGKGDNNLVKPAGKSSK